jgi:hypothetical protein
MVGRRADDAYNALPYWQWDRVGLTFLNALILFSS